MNALSFALEFHDVRLSLGGRAVLSHVSLGIGSNEFVGVLGPNGAGKTTFQAASGSACCSPRRWLATPGC